MKLATMKAQANRASALTMAMATMLMPFVGDKILALFILLPPFFRGCGLLPVLAVKKRSL